MMRIEFEDFVPSIESRGFFRRDFESLRECLARANEWIAVNEIDIVNVETVVLPGIWNPGEEGSEDPELRTSGEMSTHWHQCVRVWYRAAED